MFMSSSKFILRITLEMRMLGEKTNRFVVLLSIAKVSFVKSALIHHLLAAH